MAFFVIHVGRVRFCCVCVRFSVVNRKSDKICVVHAGTVVEQGSHEDLMATPNGRYKVLVDAAEGRGGSMAT